MRIQHYQHKQTLLLYKQNSVFVPQQELSIIMHILHCCQQLKLKCLLKVCPCKEYNIYAILYWYIGVFRLQRFQWSIADLIKLKSN